MKREDVARELRVCFSDFDPRWLDEGYPGDWEYCPQDRNWSVGARIGPGDPWEVHWEVSYSEGRTLEEALANARRHLTDLLLEMGGARYE